MNKASLRCDHAGGCVRVRESVCMGSKSRVRVRVCWNFVTTSVVLAYVNVRFPTTPLLSVCS